MKRTATLLAIAGLAFSAQVNPETFQDDEEFAPILARAGLWAVTHPQQIAKGVEIGVKAVPAVIGGTKKVIDWVQHHDDENDDELLAIREDFQDDEEFAPILARAGLWAATHPQQIAKGVEVGIKAVPAVIGGTKKVIDWIQHHDDQNDDELFAPIVARAGIWAATHPQTIARGVEAGIRSAPAVVAGAKAGANWVKNHIPHRHDDENDDELFAPIVARAGIWAATHPQQIAKGIEVGARAAPAVIGGVKKGYDWVKNHVHDDEENDDELFAPIVARAGMWAATHPQQIAKGIEVGARAAPAVIGGVKKGYDWVKNHVRDDENDNEFMAVGENIQDDEEFAPILIRAGLWAATHPQQIAKGVEIGVKAVPAVIGGTKKVIDWVQHHDDDEMFVKENVKPKRFRGEVVKSDLAQLGDLLMEGKKFRNEH